MSVGTIGSRARLAVVIGLVVFFVLLVAVVLEHQFGPIDPTDPGWKARVVNDLGQPIHVKNAAEDLTLEPGQSDIFVPSAPGQLRVIYQVTDDRGRPLGCLDVQLDRSRTVELPASGIKPCSAA